MTFSCNVLRGMLRNCRCAVNRTSIWDWSIASSRGKSGKSLNLCSLTRGSHARISPTPDWRSAWCSLARSFRKNASRTSDNSRGDVSRPSPFRRTVRFGRRLGTDIQQVTPAGPRENPRRICDQKSSLQIEIYPVGCVRCPWPERCPSRAAKAGSLDDSEEDIAQHDDRRDRGHREHQHGRRGRG